MLSRKKKYLQIALNSTLSEANHIISQLPVSGRVIIEAGTPFIKAYGEDGIHRIFSWWSRKIQLETVSTSDELSGTEITPYIVADLKAMDRGATEVEIAKRGGASAITVLGQAPVPTIDILIETCEKAGLEAIIDMMNVDQPFKILRKLRKLPKVVMLHRGVDETLKGARFPIHQINKVKGSYNVMIAIGGGDTLREVQSAVFNGADVVMLWKDFYISSAKTREIAEGFLKEIK